MNNKAMKHGEIVREKMLAFIVDYIKKNKYPPSYEEIGMAAGLKGKSSIKEHMLKLRDEGKIDYEDFLPRTITVPGLAVVEIREQKDIMDKLLERMKEREADNVNKLYAMDKGYSLAVEHLELEIKILMLEMQKNGGKTE